MTFLATYFNEFVDFSRTGECGKSLLNAIYLVISNHRIYWQKINKTNYTMAFYFTIHERWSIRQYRSYEWFDLSKYHELYWLYVAKQLHQLNYDANTISDVIRVAMRNFLTIPYTPNYSVIVPFLCALVGGSIINQNLLIDIIKLLKEEERRCLSTINSLSNEDEFLDISQDQEIQSQSTEYLELILPLIFKLK